MDMTITVPSKKHKGIKKWPKADRPREKLLTKGADTLTDSELLAILLRTGTKGISAIDLAREVLDKFGNFRNMVQTDCRDWKGIGGLGNAKTAQILAALEIGRRFREKETRVERNKINSIREIVDICAYFGDFGRVHGSFRPVSRTIPAGA